MATARRTFGKKSTPKKSARLELTLSMLEEVFSNTLKTPQFVRKFTSAMGRLFESDNWNRLAEYQPRIAEMNEAIERLLSSKRIINAKDNQLFLIHYAMFCERLQENDKAFALYLQAREIGRAFKCTIFKAYTYPLHLLRNLSDAALTEQTISRAQFVEIQRTIAPLSALLTKNTNIPAIWEESYRLEEGRQSLNRMLQENADEQSISLLGTHLYSQLDDEPLENYENSQDALVNQDDFTEAALDASLFPRFDEVDEAETTLMSSPPLIRNPQPTGTWVSLFHYSEPRPKLTVLKKADRSIRNAT